MEAYINSFNFVLAIWAYSFLDHLEFLNSKEYSEERHDLIKWAREKADWMDPTKEKEIEILKNINPLNI